MTDPTQHIHEARDAAGAGLGAWMLHDWSKAQDQKAFTALDQGDVEAAQQIEHARAKRFGWGSTAVAAVLGYSFWWLPVLIFFIVSTAMQKIDLATVNNFSWPAAIISLGIYVFGLWGLIGHFDRHTARKRQQRWDQHYAIGQQRIAQANQPPPPPTPPTDDGYGTPFMPKDDGPQPTAPGSDEWLAGNLQRMQRRLGLSDTQPIDKIGDDA